MTMDKWSALEERVTQLVGTLKRLREGNVHLQADVKRLEEDLSSKAGVINQLQKQNEELALLEEEHHRFQQEREEIHNRLEKMLGELEQVQLEAVQLETA